MKADKNIDKLFAEGLEGHELTPSADVWKGLQSGLLAQKLQLQKKRLTGLVLIILFITAVLTAGLGWKIMSMNKEIAQLHSKLMKDNAVAENLNEGKAGEARYDTITSQNQNQRRDQSDVSSYPITVPESFSDESDEVGTKGANTKHPTTGNEESTIQNTQQRQGNSQLDQNIRGNTAGNSAKYQHKNFNRDKAQAKPVLAAPESELINLSSSALDENPGKKSYSKASRSFSKEKITSQQIPPVSFFNIQLPELRNDKREIKLAGIDKTQWDIGLYGMANFNDVRLVGDGLNGELLADSINARESNATTYGFGVSIGAQFTSGWRLTTGLEYSSWCRRAKNRVLFNTGQTNIGTSEGLGSSSGQGSHVNLSTGPVSVEPPAPTESFTSADDSVQFELRSEECYQLLSIPLNLEYEIRFDRLALLPGIGMQYDRVLNWERQFQNISERGFPTIETDNKSKENFFAYALSLSAEYDLNTRISLRLSGRYKSWLTPIYQDENFKSLPFVYSGQFGLMYRISK